MGDLVVPDALDGATYSFLEFLLFLLSYCWEIVYETFAKKETGVPTSSICAEFENQIDFGEKIYFNINFSLFFGF